MTLFASSGYLTFVSSYVSLGGRGGSLVYGYGDEDLNRTEGPVDKGSGDEDSIESNSVSISVQSLL